MIAPGDELLVRIGLRPSGVGEMARAITISSSKVVRHALTIRVKASVVSPYALEPTSVDVSQDCAGRAIALQIAGTDGADFSGVKFEVPGGQILSLSDVKVTPSRLELTLERASVAADGGVFAGSSGMVRANLSFPDGHTDVVEIPVRVQSATRVSPSRFSVSQGRSRKFFISGSFGFPIDQLNVAELRLDFGEDRDSVRVIHQWRSENLCVAKFELPSGIETGAHAALFLKVSGGKEIFVANLSFFD